MAHTLPPPPTQSQIQTVPDADWAIRQNILQYLARLVTSLDQSIVSSFATWTPGAIGNGGFVSATVTLRGVAPPTPVSVGFTTAIPAGMILSAICTSQDTVTISLFNFTGAGQNIGAGTLLVIASLQF